jgi:hypothetical protein
VAEVPEGGAELERVLRGTCACGLAVGSQTGGGFVELLGLKRRAAFDDGVDLGSSGVCDGVPGAGDGRAEAPCHRACPRLAEQSTTG